MSAAPDILTQVYAAGGCVMMVRDRLKVRAPLPLPDELVADLRRHKAEIMALLLDRKAAWTPEDWRAFFDERAAIAQHNGGLSRAEAEARAYECCIVEWLNHHLERSDPGHCAWCEKPDRDGHAVVPFGTESNGHTWLHPDCWNPWHENRREEARQALAAMGLDTHPKCAKRAQ